MQRIPRSNKWRRITTTVVAILALIALVLYLGYKKHFGPEHYAQLALDGIRGGSIYALIALGFVVIHSVTGIINFAQGEFVMLGEVDDAGHAVDDDDPQGDEGVNAAATYPIQGQFSSSSPSAPPLPSVRWPSSFGAPALTTCPPSAP